MAKNLNSNVQKALTVVVIVVVVIVAAVIGVGWYVYHRYKVYQELKHPKFSSGNGRLEATEVYVSSKLAGRIDKIFVKEGDLVLAEPATPETNKSNAPVIRKLVYGDNEEDRWLTATNPDFPGTRTVKARDILGKVVAIFRKL